MANAADKALEAEVLALEAKLDKVDLFALLGLPPGADEAQVKSTFYKLSRRYHPDRHFRENLGPLKPKLLKVFRALSQAHQTLTNPELREAYLTANPHLRKVVVTKLNKRMNMSMADVQKALAGPPKPPQK
jgi:DnaJ-class molecular chaperone